MKDFLATVLPSPADTSDSVTRVIESTPVTIFCDSDSSRSGWERWWLESRFRRITRLESQSM